VTDNGGGAMNDKSYLGRIIEGLVVFLILMVMIETLFEEYATFADFSVRIRQYVLIAGFCFDLVFSIEFFARLFLSARRRGVAEYFGNEGGTIDFFSSIPLLVLNSGPLIWMTFFSGEAGLFAVLGSISFLKVVKVLRVARTLRFMRTLKMFGKIRTKYRMTPKYVARAVSLAVTVIVVALMGFSFMGRGSVIQPRFLSVEKILSNYLLNTGEPEFKQLLSGVESVLIIEKDGVSVYSTVTKRAFEEEFFGDDYSRTAVMGYDVYFSNKDMKKTVAFINMLVYSMVIGIIILLSTVYRIFFNRHISSVLGVMIRGFKNAEYLTPVRAVRKRRDFEVYQLADQYNKKWLPVKRKILEIKKKNV
jgi:hypothetical protein